MERSHNITGIEIIHSEEGVQIILLITIVHTKTQSIRQFTARLKAGKLDINDFDHKDIADDQNFKIYLEGYVLGYLQHRRLNSTQTATNPFMSKETVHSMIDIFQSDPHQFSSRPCGTCTIITKLIQDDFGCCRYAKKTS